VQKRRDCPRSAAIALVLAVSKATVALKAVAGVLLSIDIRLELRGRQQSVTTDVVADWRQFELQTWPIA